MANLSHLGFGENGSDANERLAEVAEILTAGQLRLETRKSSQKPPDLGESSLHFTPDQSGDPPPCSAEVFS